MSEALDVIIPVAGKEVHFVHRVTAYVRKNLPEANTLYIITSNKNISYLKKKVSCQDRVEVLDEDKLVSGLTMTKLKEYAFKYTKCPSVGWYYQQFLKLGFALSIYAKKYFLSWDADTIPVSKISFFEGGKPLFTRKSEYNDNYFATMKRLLGLDKMVPYSFIAEHMLFDVSITKELLKAIESSNNPGLLWYEKIMRACDFSHSKPCFSEFETYGTYVMTHYSDKYETRQLRTFRRGGIIRGRFISDNLLEKLSIDLDTISFEMRDEPSFPYNIPNKWWKIIDVLTKVIDNPLIAVNRIIKLVKR